MRKYVFTLVAIAFTVAAQAQSNALTAKDYERAEKFMSYNTEPFIDAGTVRPNWLPNDRFWYLSVTAKQNSFMLVDPVQKPAPQLLIIKNWLLHYQPQAVPNTMQLNFLSRPFIFPMMANRFLLP